MAKTTSIYFPESLVRRIEEHQPELATFGSVVKYLVQKGIEAIENEKKIIKGKKVQA